VALLLAALCGGLWWQYGGQVASVWAVVEGGSIPIVAAYSARVDAVLVREGDAVEARQPLVRLDATGFAGRIHEAAGETAALRSDMRAVASRMQEVEEAERDIVTRLATARNEEDAHRQLRERRVAEHVRAQLAVRGMDAQGGAGIVGKAAYAKAVEEEMTARKRMEDAKDAFERVSRGRAVLERELAAAREAGLSGGERRDRVMRATPFRDVDGVLVAPVRGRVARVTSRSGEELQRGDTALVIMPEGLSGDGRDVLAFFPPGAGVAAGQSCVVAFSEGARREGEVAQVPVDAAMLGRVGEMLPRMGLAGYAMARIRLAGGSAPATPGDVVSCRVGTRTFKAFGDMFARWFR
jgi:membrane fusion protein (multidrug efflux system)